MTTRGNIGFRSTRTGMWAESKGTNTNRFDPANIEIRKVVRKNFDRIYRKNGIVIFQQPTHPAFLLPVKELDIRSSLQAVPSEFTQGLAAVILLGGSKKQEQTFKQRFAYGRYDDRVIYLHPYPKKYMESCLRSAPKPNVANEYKRAGATIARQGNRWLIRFDEKSLKQFYLRDVLIHELGHHVDAMCYGAKTHKKAEGFAEWFAVEYGYRPQLR